MEEGILQTLQEFKVLEEERPYLFQIVEEEQRQWRSQEEKIKHSLQLQLSNVADRLTRLTDAFLDGSIEKELFEEKKLDMYQKKKDLEEQLALNSDGDQSQMAKAQQFFELAGSLYSTYQKGLPEEKRKLLQITTSNRTVQGKNVEVMLKNPFREMAECLKKSSSGPYRARLRTFIRNLPKIQAFTADSTTERIAMRNYG